MADFKELFDSFGETKPAQETEADPSLLKKKGRKRGRWKPPPSTARWRDLYQTCSGTVKDSLSAAKDAIGVVERGDRLYVVSHGNWSMEYLICHIGEQLGPCELRMATWAVNDDAVLRLATAIDEGYVTRCRAVVDERMKVVRPAALDIMQTALGEGNLGIMACHMKAYTLRTESGLTCTVVGSANWTQNPRPEAMVIDADPRAEEFISGWVDDALETMARPYRHTGKLREELITIGQDDASDRKQS